MFLYETNIYETYVINVEVVFSDVFLFSALMLLGGAEERADSSEEEPASTVSGQAGV